MSSFRGTSYEYPNDAGNWFLGGCGFVARCSGGRGRSSSRHGVDFGVNAE